MARSRLAGANIEAVLCSYGPIMNQTKAAATDFCGCGTQSYAHTTFDTATPPAGCVRPP